VHRTLLAGLVLAAIPAAASTGTLYKCENGQGSRYQNAPCPQGTKQTVVDKPTLSQQINEGDPKTGTFTPQALGLRQQTEQAIGVLATFPACAQADPAFAKAHGAGFEAWKKKNAAFIQRIQADPVMRSALENGMALEKKRAADPAEREKQAKECSGEIATALKG
jgi:hypothetical protein